MASGAPNKNFVARAAAILTTAEVAGNSFDLNEAWGSQVHAQVDFTIGSLTNVVLRFYGSMDGTNFYLLNALTQTLTASLAGSFHVTAPGWKFLRVSAQGTGTVTSSSLALGLRYLRRGSQ